MIAISGGVVLAPPDDLCKQHECTFDLYATLGKENEHTPVIKHTTIAGSSVIEATTYVREFWVPLVFEQNALRPGYTIYMAENPCASPPGCWLHASLSGTKRNVTVDYDGHWAFENQTLTLDPIFYWRFAGSEGMRPAEYSIVFRVCIVRGTGNPCDAPGGKNMIQGKRRVIQKSADPISQTTQPSQSSTQSLSLLIS